MKLDLQKIIDAARKAGLSVTQTPSAKSGLVDLVIASAVAADPKAAAAVAIVKALDKAGVTAAVAETFSTAAGECCVIRGLPAPAADNKQEPAA